MSLFTTLVLMFLFPGKFRVERTQNAWGLSYIPAWCIVAGYVYDELQRRKIVGNTTPATKPISTPEEPNVSQQLEDVEDAALRAGNPFGGR